MKCNRNRHVLVKTLDLADAYTGVLEPVEQLNDGEKYYLVEGRAPEGYIASKPMEVKLVLTDEYDTSLWEEDEDGNKTDIPATGLYNWKQTAVLTINGEAARRTNADGTGNLNNTNLAADATMDNAYYKIYNNPGVELPATGGPGIHLIYLFGILFTAIASAGLVMKKRRAA